MVNVLFCSGLEKAEGVGMALRAMLGTDVNSVASSFRCEMSSIDGNQDICTALETYRFVE